MTWRDIDICLAMESPAQSIGVLFSLGGELAALPGAATLYFRNEFVLQTDGNPRAVFWCVEFLSQPGSTWKVDILVSTANEVEGVLAEGHALLGSLTPAQRMAILKLKFPLSGHPLYRVRFRSTDIYRAAIEEGITAPAAFLARHGIEPQSVTLA
jgi:hypothetical protein